jgi:hypothetical protein
MPVIRITRMGGELVYEGEGELVLDPDPFAPGRQGHLAIRQERRRDGEVLSRQLDITELMTQTGASYTSRVYFPPVSLSFDFSTDPPTAAILEPPQAVTELRVEGEAPWLDWLRNVLEEPVETPEERQERNEQYAEARRRAMMDARMPLEEIRAQLGLPEHDLLQMAHRAVEADIERNRRVALGESPDPGGLRQGLEAMAENLRRAVAEAYDLPESVLGPDPAHDELIESARSEFPHDPYQYGRIYPGDSGASRWTPPEDPDEKIRSCP